MYGSRSFFIYNAFWTNQLVVDAVSKGILKLSMPYQPLKLSFVKGIQDSALPFESMLENGQGIEGNPMITNIFQLCFYLGYNDVALGT